MLEPEGATATVLWIAHFVGAYWLVTMCHEAFHVAAACVLGHFSVFTQHNLLSATCSKHVHVPGASGWHGACIRHAGWAGSVLLATLLSTGTLYVPESCTRFGIQWQAAAWLTG